ncbi:MAG: C4-type zinc ribbon domain-containing protein [Dehalococcoidia bacterium]
MNTAKVLLTLQATDQELAMKRREYRTVVQKLDSQGGVPELREAAEKARVRALEARVEHAKLESEQASLRERVGELEARLYSGAITNVRELTAIETEHNAARRQLAQVEEAVGPALAGAEDARQRHEDLTKELQEREEAWKTTEAELQAEKVRLGREYAEMGEQRVSATTGIPPGDLALYNALLPSKGGVAVVRVERGVCQGCRVRLPLGEIARIRNTTGLVPCSSCGRILLAE